MAIIWQSQGGVASKILQWQHEGKLLKDGETTCNGDAIAFWRWHGGVALTTILHKQHDGKLLNNGQSDCLQWQCHGELEAVWRCGVDNNTAWAT
jgi:hypothetical protein